MVLISVFSRSLRYVMIVGMTGAGKSLLINNIINYVYGVDYTDNFRFKLIVEEEEINERDKGSSTSQAHSMTSWVSAFTLHYQNGFRIPFSITLIDTPGFGDTRGFSYDEVIISQIKDFFTNDLICQSSEITCIGLVMQSSQARITAEQKYIVDQVLQLFAKDIKDNIFLFFTFADGEPPPVLKVIDEEKIPHAKGRQFKFNNSALYAGDSEFFWDFGFKSLKAFFDALLVTQSISLKLTKQNLEERERLRLTLENLRPQIEKGMAHLEKIRAETDVLKKLKGDIECSKNYKVTTIGKKEIAVNVQHSITNCNVCHHTCHDPCMIEGDVKEDCAAMTDGCCRECTGKCHWTKHTNGWDKYVLRDIKETSTVAELFYKYNVSIKDKQAKKKILVELISEYGEIKMIVFDQIKEANECSNKLDEISLRPNYLNNVQYIERMIQSERSKTKGITHREKRLKELTNMKSLALLLQDVRTGPEVLPDKVIKMEQQIQKVILEALDRIEDDNDYEDAKAESKKTVDETIKNWCKKVWKCISS